MVPQNMEASEVLCYKDFLSWHRRSGGALVAESDVSKNIEARFGKFYVPHIADLEILSTIHSNISEPAFLMKIVGVPGVGKTKLLRELAIGLNLEDFPPKDRSFIKEVIDTYEFCDVEELGSPKQKTPKAKGAKKKIWMTLNIDEFVSITPGKDPLGELFTKLNAGLFKGESLIICGNVGALENEDAKKAIDNIQKLVDLRNQRRVKSVRFPLYESLYWTKEYGVNIKKYGIEGDPSFLVGGLESFQNYSTRLIALGRKILEECSFEANKRLECKNCPAPQYLNYIRKLEQLLAQEDFASRLHDLMQFLWLEYPDVYLVARTLNIFWGYALTELWRVVEGSATTTLSEDVDKSMIYASIYHSKLPSIYRVSEYYLSDTQVHRFRDSEIEQKLIHSSKHPLNDSYFRLRKRLEYFFEVLARPSSREKIYGGVFEEYMEEEKLSASVTDIARKLVLMRLDKSLLYVPEDDERLKELFREPWGFGQLLLASKIAVRPSSGGKNVPLMIFHKSVLNDVDVRSGISFEEIQHPSHYLANREKMLRLKLRLGKSTLKSLQEKAPVLHLSLSDYASLRNFTKGIGKPDISLQKPTQVKILSFLGAIDGFVMHQVRPLLWRYLKRDITDVDPSRILIRTLGPNTRRCTLDVREKEITVGLEGIEIVKLSTEGFP